MNGGFINEPTSWAMAALALSSWTLVKDEIRSGAPLPKARNVTCGVGARVRVQGPQPGRG